MTYDEYCEKVFELIPEAEYICINNMQSIFWCVDKPEYDYFLNTWKFEGRSWYLGHSNYKCVTPPDSLRQRKWVPKEGERYYYPFFSQSKYEPTCFDKGDCHDLMRKENYLCFKTQEEAILVTEKMLELYKSSLKG